MELSPRKGFPRLDGPCDLQEAWTLRDNVWVSTLVQKEEITLSVSETKLLLNESGTFNYRNNLGIGKNNFVLAAGPRELKKE